MFAVMLLSTTAASAAELKTVSGYWLVKKKDVLVVIKPCEEKSGRLCGSIAWLSPDAKQQRDVLNPDASKRKRALCGIRVMWDMQQNSEQKPDYNGKIYKPTNGTIYQATMTLADADTLEIRGYIGVPLLGKTVKLTRANPDEFQRCIPHDGNVWRDK
ncbi:MAG: DUF2147 domain-containing protein [Rickettsiales bacterium]|nr:DUF2147 domain-containing protein [Rickettsiales bacterium]